MTFVTHILLWYFDRMFQRAKPYVNLLDTHSISRDKLDYLIVSYKNPFGSHQAKDNYSYSS